MRLSLKIAPSAVLLGLLGLSGCLGEDEETAQLNGTDTEGGSGAATDGETEGDTDGEGDEAITITHAFGPLSMAAYEDNASRCGSWTLDNEEAIYAQAVTMANEGFFHHSNWFVVPEDVYPGEDGYWDCKERGYSESGAAVAGTVLFAQSTQSYTEEQRLSPGAVVKIPPRSKIVVGLHTLNLSPRDTKSRLWLTLEPIHPSEVTAVVSPLAIQYSDLLIPSHSESRFRADCDLDRAHENATGNPMNLQLHYILPHYHYLGNYFDVTVRGGARDGESILRFEGFDGEANGVTFDPPLDLGDATGLSVTCGFDNWRSEDVTWGNGDGEMCIAMMLVEADAVMAGTVDNGMVTDVDGDIPVSTGDCVALAVKKSKGQTMPTPEEMEKPLYLPPMDPEDQDLPPVPECTNADPTVAPAGPGTLQSIRDNIFIPACTFSSCHAAGAAGGLDLMAEDLHGALLNHEVRADAGMPLVSPGSPEQSWLYRIMAECEPTLQSGAIVPHMPRNAPTLMEPGLIAELRAWIENGAKP